MLYDVVPNQVYPGQTVQYMVNPMRALHDGAVDGDDLPIEELSLGGTLTSYGETITSDTRPAGYIVRDPLTAVVGDDQAPAKDVEPRARFRVGDSYIQSTAKHCNFAGDDCWNVRVHPVIDSISASEGSVTGGQELRITGFGLLGDAEVHVNGVECDVKSASEGEIICSTGEAGAPSVTGPQPGSPGLIQTLDGKKTLLTTFETHVNLLHRDNVYFDGFFKAPAAGNYKFHLSSDDHSHLSLDEAKFDASAPAEASFVQKANRSYASGWRDFHAEIPSVMDNASEWITLEEGEYYPIQGYLREHSGQDHFSVAVEYEMSETASAGHHHRGQ
jgi:hypothetical protein